MEDESVPAGVPAAEAAEILSSAAKRGVAVVRRQRVLLAELLDVASGTLQELREMQVISKETLE